MADGKKVFLFCQCVSIKTFITRLVSTSFVIFDDQSALLNWILNWIPEAYLEPGQPNRQLPVQNYTRNTRTRCEICLKSTIKTPERPVSLLLTLNIFQNLFYCFIVNFEHVIDSWLVKGLSHFSPDMWPII